MNQISPIYAHSIHEKEEPREILVRGIEVKIYSNGVYAITRDRGGNLAYNVYRYLLNEGFIVPHFTL